MISFVLNKLVRDKVYDSMVEMGQEVESEVLEGKERERALLDKFSEELQELLDGDDSDPVDLGSVLMAYAYSQGSRAIQRS